MANEHTYPRGNRMKNTIFALACLLPLAAHAEKYSTYAESPGTAVGFATSVWNIRLVREHPGMGLFKPRP